MKLNDQYKRLVVVLAVLVGLVALLATLDNFERTNVMKGKEVQKMDKKADGHKHDDGHKH